MDPFTENILARARERQRILEGYSDTEKTPLRETNNDKALKASSQPNLSDVKKIQRKEVVSDSTLNTKFSPEFKENKSDSNVNKFPRNGSRTRVSSEMSGSPQPQLKTLNIQKDNFNMEIKVTSSDKIRVEVEIEEQDNDSDSGSHTSESGLREDAKKRLNRLGKLYAGGDDADISSPIHRTEAKFYQNDEQSAKQRIFEREDKKTGKGLRKLADLAENINQWEDEITHSTRVVENAGTPKKAWKAPAPQPPSANPSPSKIKPKPRAPKPPQNNSSAASPEKSQNSSSDPVKSHNPVKPQNYSSPVQSENSASPMKSRTDTKVIGATTKQLKWDQNVLNTLESQGFTRTSSNSRLVYSYHSQEKDNHKKRENLKEMTNIAEEVEEKTVEVKSTTIGNVKSKFEKTTESPSKVCPRSPAKSRGIADRAALFESNSVASSPVKNTKDPALLSVSERKALFEKNKGAALVPKTAFGMAAPMKDDKAAKPLIVKKPEEIPKKPVEEPKPVKKSPPKKNYPAPKPPVVVDSAAQNSPTVAAVSQNAGIASKMAALLEGKTTISEEQIANKAKEERQKEMDMLLNRFHKSKEIPKSQENEDSDEDGVDESDEKTAMIREKKSVTIVTKPIVHHPSSSESSSDSRKSGGKRMSNSSDSPIVSAVLEDVKRIRVSPAKPGRLYPNLSDIEANTDDTRTPSPDNSSFYGGNESDDPNTSFGRDILQAVCQNQTPQKRPIYDESTASDISSALDDFDYLNEVSEDDNVGPTPAKQVRSEMASQHITQPSHSFNYKKYSKSPKSQFKSPMKVVAAPRKSTDSQKAYVVDGDNLMPLTHTVSFYRKQQTQLSTTPVRKITRQLNIDESVPLESKSIDSDVIRKKIKELQNEVSKQQMVISQTSQALNLCSCTPEFSGSTEQVEAEKVLLVATQRRLACLHEIQRLEVEGSLRPKGEHSQNVPIEKGTLTISNIVLPLKQKYVTALAAAGGKGHHVVCLIKCGDQVISTILVSTVASCKKNPETELYIPGTVTVKNIYSDFTVTFEVYCLQAQEEFLPHEVKYHIGKKGSSKATPKKSKQDSRLTRPIKESPAGPQAVRSPSFALMGYVVFSVKAVSKKLWSLNNTPSMSPLEGSVEMKIQCELAATVEHRGFLTMFEDVSGFGAWHRRWCLLKGHSLSFWKYPDDERKLPPIDTIDLKKCITTQVGPVSRDICARLHTFLLERERIAYPQDKDTLVMVCKGDKTIIRHLLSADTKEERMEWCNKFNSALTAFRMWGSN